MRLRVGLVIAGIATLAAAPPARADTFTVTGTDDGAGECAAGACTTLRAAIAAADANGVADAIELAALTYDVGSELQVGSDVTLTGTGAPATVIRGDGKSRVLHVTAGGRLAVEHATVANGFAEAPGDIGGNVMVNSRARLVLDHSRVTGGTSLGGGGIAIAGGGSARISHSLVDGNQAVPVTGLTGSGQGGGILAVSNAEAPDGIKLDVSDSTVSGNTALDGAGIAIRDDTRNVATLSRSTVAGNSASSAAGVGGIYAEDGERFTATASIVAGNTGGGSERNCAGTLTSGGWNVDSGSSCGLATETDLQGTDPALGKPTSAGGETPVLPIARDSPAVDLVPIGAQACGGTDQRDLVRPQGKGCDAGAYEVAKTPPAAPVISSPPDGTLQNTSTVALSGTAEPGSVVEVFEGDASRGTTTVAADGAWMLSFDAPDGTHLYTATTTDADGNTSTTSMARTVRIDTTPPTTDVQSGPSGDTTDDSPAFTFVSDDTEVSFECRLDGPGGAGSYGPCGSPARFSGLAAGPYTFFVRARDAAGNVSETSRSFAVVAAQQRSPTPTPTPTPTPAPTPSHSPTPTVSASPSPRPGLTVVVAPVKGTTLVKLPGSSKFVPLDVTQGIPLGSTLDTRHGRLRLSARRRLAKPVETALFYGGIFRVSQTAAVTQMRLVERIAACRATTGRASAARERSRSRRLWGNGKGRFRTSGQYSSATVRGTKWLVEDSCGKTVTRVARGVVSVNDFVKRKTVRVRAGHSYRATARRG